MELNKDNLYWMDESHTSYAVLVSPGYGAGWSTWNSEYGVKLATDKRIVQYIIDCQEDRKKWDVSWQYHRISNSDCDGARGFKKFLNDIGYNADSIYLGGVRNIEVKKVNVRDRWHITEYDGSESLYIFSEYDDDWNFVRES